jgi:hypothetical protein
MASAEQKTSFAAVEEYYAARDDRFVDVLRRFDGLKPLAAFASRWYRDGDSWARSQLFGYFEQPLNCPGHHALVKRILRQAESAADDELMAALLVAFDRSVRRRRVKRYIWDYRTYTSTTTERVVGPRDAIRPVRTKRYVDPYDGRIHERQRRVSETDRLYSLHTRHYLRRRAWRYFRRMGYQRPADYPRCVGRALARYEDGDFERGENLLDNWGLMHACYRESELLRFAIPYLHLAEGKRLSGLQAAPAFGGLWAGAAGYEQLCQLLVQARSRLMRLWSMQLLERLHPQRLAGVDLSRLLGWLEHPDEEVQTFAATRLRGHTEIGTLPLTEWLRLLAGRNPTVLQLICELFAQHVHPERLTPAQLVEIACAEAAPVARLGFELLQKGYRATAPWLEALQAAAEARCEAIGEPLGAFALQRVGAAERYQVDRVVRFFDALNPACPPRGLELARRGLARSQRSAAMEPAFGDPLRRCAVAPDRRAAAAQPPGRRGRCVDPALDDGCCSVHRGGRQKQAGDRATGG